MPTPTIPAGNLFMNATLYTGNGSTQTITNGGTGQSFQPDLVWTKARSAAIAGLVYDSVRGATKYLQTNSSAAEGTGADSLTAFASNGFTVGADTSTTGVNQNTTTYVGWQWKAGGAAVTNTQGTITSSVSANQTSGFSVVTYTGNNVAGATIGHGLGVAPSMIIVKKRNTNGDWPVYHASVGNTGALYLDLTLATQTLAAVWNNTSPTSTVFSVGGASASGSGDVNANASTYVAYCWAPIAGYSAFGSYTGNGSTDGTFVFLNFQPRWVMIKRTDSANDWIVWDSSRDTYNASQNFLLPNSSASESGGIPIDLVSNGFKIRTTNATLNASGGTYVYACFASNPFKYSNAR